MKGDGICEMKKTAKMKKGKRPVLHLGTSCSDLIGHQISQRRHQNYTKITIDCDRISIPWSCVILAQLVVLFCCVNRSRHQEQLD